MLLLFFAHIIISFGCLISGFLFYELFRQKNLARPTVFYLISGLILLTIFSQVIVLFYPIDLYVQLSLAFIISLIALLRSQACKELLKRVVSEFRSWSALSVLLFFTSWVIVLLFNAGPLAMDDTESYHIQSIKWIQEYGSVPGIANLHERYGFNSSWFIDAALFSFSNKSTGGFTVLNGVLSVWLCYWCISKINRFQKENNYPNAFAVMVVFLTSMIVWPLIRGNAATTNYDFVTTCCVIILFTEIFFSKDFAAQIEWLIWPVYLVTVRIVNFPVLLLSLIALVAFIHQKKFKSLFLPIACCLLLIIPFIIRNVIISGYPFFPSTSFNLADVDWKADPQIAESWVEFIRYFNRVSTEYLDLEQTKALGSNWVSSWYKYLFPYNKVLVVASLAGILSFLPSRVHWKNKNQLVLTATSILWLISWFFIAPDPRFAYGVLVFGIMLFGHHSALLIRNIRLLKLLMRIGIMVITAGSLFYFISKLSKEHAQRNFVVASKLPQPPLKKFLVDGITISIPEPIYNNWNARCYGTDLPCLYRIDHRLRLRGKDISSGFRLEK